MPRLHIDLKKIEHNARLVSELIEPFGLRLVVVTKACLGDGRVAAAMLAGAATAGHGVADSRLENIKRVRQRLPGLGEGEVELLRPPLESGRLVPNLVYYVTSTEQAEALLAKRPYKYYQMSLCLQVDTGDGREGVPAGQAAAEAKKIAELDGAHFTGIATNLACADPSVPLKEALLLFGRTAAEVRGSTTVSAGGSGLLKLLLELPAGEAAPLFGPLTELRCGEAILLGRIPSGEKPELYLPGANRDAFILEGAVLEVYAKAGRRQALVDIGVQDIGAGGLAPLDAGIKPVSATSDCLVVELEGAAGGIAAGGIAAGGIAAGGIAAGSGATGDAAASGGSAPAAGSHFSFIPDYYALVGAMTSPFVDKIYKGKMV